MNGREVKDRLKRAVKRAVLAAGTVTRPRHPTSRILTYHSIGYRAHEMNVTPEEFGRQMEWLAQQGQVIALEEASEKRPGVAITLDDGYRDNLLHAAPVLQRLGLPATVFMIPGFAGSALGPNDDPASDPLMDWDELRELVSMGIEIGAHTLTHRRLAPLDENAQAFEIFGSKKALEEHLGRPVRAFAYPFGSALDYNDISMELVRRAGFDYAVSNRYGINRPEESRWALRRIWIDATDDFAAFRAKVDGRLDLLRLIDQPAAVRLRQGLNRLLGTE